MIAHHNALCLRCCLYWALYWVQTWRCISCRRSR